MARKTTNVEELKNVLRCLLHLPLADTPMSPFIVAHPIFESGTVSYLDENGQPSFLDIYNNEENFNKAIKSFEELHLPTINNIDTCLFLIRNPYKLAFLKFGKSYMSREDFSRSLGRVWTEIENGNHDLNVSKATLVSWFKSCDRTHLMSNEEREYLDSLPNEITIYRGLGGKIITEDGLSWTEDFEIAKWFAKRYGVNNGYILKGVVKKGDILAYFDRVGTNNHHETEIVVPYDKVMNIETVYNFDIKE